MNEELSKKTGFWAILGKLAAILGVVWLIIQMWTSVLPSKDYSLNVIGDSSVIVLPETIYQHLDDIYQLTNNEDILKIKDQLQNIEEVWGFTIINNGRKEATGITLELPFDGIYKIDKHGEVSFGDYQNKISLGSLNPSEDLIVQVWSKHWPTNIITFSRRSLTMQVPFTNGKSRINFANDPIDRIVFDVAVGISLPLLFIGVFLLTKKFKPELFNIKEGNRPPI